jgi:hypothetical protein
MLGLLAYVPAPAQSGDTSTVAADTSTVVANSNGTATDSAEPVVLRMIDDSVVRGWKGEKPYEYANDSAYWRWYGFQVQSGRPTERRTTPFLPGKWLEYFLLFLCAAVLLYAIVRIIVTNRLQLFYRPPKRMTTGNAGVEAFTPEDDPEGQLTHLVQTKEYREAVRFLYLKTLRLLNDRGMIRYHPESTNQEYWQQLSATPQGRPFRDLITIYENVWYGEFSMGDALFIRLREYFDDFYKSVQA